MDIVNGSVMANTLDTEITKTRDYIAQRTNAVTPVDKGGTGSTTAAAARSALGITASNIPASSGNVQSQLDGKLTRTQSQYNADFAARDSQISGLSSGKLDKVGGTITGTLGVNGQLFVGDKPPASFSFVVAYFNGDNRLSAGASSRRWKQDIDREPVMPDLFSVPIAEFAMRQDPDKTRRFGYIAEDLADSPELQRFVVYDDKGLPFSYDMMALLLAQCAQLNEKVTALQARVDELEAGE